MPAVSQAISLPLEEMVAQEGTDMYWAPTES